MKARILTLRAWSRDWWAAFHRDVAAGRPVGFLAEQAKRGRGRAINAADMPLATERAMLVPVTVGSEAFAAWALHYERLGLRLPRPDKAAVVWMPSAMPADMAA